MAADLEYALDYILIYTCISVELVTTCHSLLSPFNSLVLYFLKEKKQRRKCYLLRRVYPGTPR